MAKKHPQKRRANFRNISKVALEKTVKALEIPPDIVGGMMHLEISGNREAVVEGKCAVLEYDNDVIRLSAGKHILRFTGRGLTMRSLRKDSAVIEGYILSVEYL
ncbi:MAG TPA: sporulation protein [Ruminococcaceae bacterium]|nr:sporulation protein [Oscillospiraceae bacterium]